MIIKKCPKCNRVYDDSWGVCLHCNEPLIAQSASQPGNANINTQCLEVPKDSGAYLSTALGYTLLMLIIFMSIANMKTEPEFSMKAFFQFIFFPAAIINSYIIAFICCASHKDKLFKVFTIVIFLLLVSTLVPLWGFDIFDKLKQWGLHSNWLFSAALIIVFGVYVTICSVIPKLPFLNKIERKKFDKIVGLIIILIGTIVILHLISPTTHRILSGQWVGDDIGLLTVVLSIYFFPLFKVGIYLLKPKNVSKKLLCKSENTTNVRLMCPKCKQSFDNTWKVCLYCNSKLDKIVE